MKTTCLTYSHFLQHPRNQILVFPFLPLPSSFPTFPVSITQAPVSITGHGTKKKKSCPQGVCVSFAIVSQDLRSRMRSHVQSSIAHGMTITRDFQAARPFTLTEIVAQSDGNAVCSCHCSSWACICISRM